MYLIIIWRMGRPFVWNKKKNNGAYNSKNKNYNLSPTIQFVMSLELYWI